MVFKMEIEPHKPTTSETNPCKDCVLSYGMLACLDRTYCTVKKDGNVWRKKVKT
jgi:hypothetical protein